MTVLAALALASLLLASLPVVVSIHNRGSYRAPPPAERVQGAVSVLIPARDEEESIADAIRSVRENRGVEFEILVLDDGSTDRTAEVVAREVALDERVRLIEGPSMPEGWCGKQHAGATRAARSSHPVLVFLDADVRLEPGGLARVIGFLENSGADLVSGFPRQSRWSPPSNLWAWTIINL